MLKRAKLFKLSMKWLITSILVLLFSISFSQDFNGGPILGFVATQVDGDSLGGYNRFGPALGVFIQREFSDKLDFKAELKYVQKGSKTKGDIKENDDYLEIRLQYIELPLLLHYKYRNKIGLETGLALGYLFKAEEDHSALGFEDARSFYSNTETSILAGIQYQFTEQLSVNARMNYSIFRVSKITSGGRLWTNRGKYNNVLSFTIYYLL